jgi:hypothetical protein
MYTDLFQNTYSEEKSIKILSLSKNFKVLNVSFLNKNSLSIRDKPYGEVLIYDESKKYYNDYVIIDNTITTSDFSELDIKE